MGTLSNSNSKARLLDYAEDNFSNAMNRFDSSYQDIVTAKQILTRENTVNWIWFQTYTISEDIVKKAFVSGCSVM